MSAILFDSSRVRKSSKFGRGVLRSLPTYQTNISAEDEAAYLAMKYGGPDYDRMAQEAAAADRLERGLIC